MLEIKANLRKEIGSGLDKIRKEGFLPGVVYGHGIDSRPIAVSEKDFVKLYQQAGESTLLVLNLDGAKKTVLVHGAQYDPLTDKPLHVDFYEVKMDEKIQAQVPLVFIGESPAVKSEGGILVKSIQEVEVEALPADLPHHIEADISRLVTFEDHICIKDLKISGSVKILVEPEEIVASVSQPRSEEELAALEEKIEAPIEEVKVVGEEEKAAEAAEAAEETAIPEEKK
ncbi:MAG: 50S ribosomal protein L25 [Candidatus Portnoybacteria bacterium]|nr:50S ribosomal protein L25 [Candidatus Portnoybacteria bacterium]